MDEKMLRELMLFSLKMKRLWKDLTAVNSCLMGECKEDVANLFLNVHSNSRGGSRCRLEHGQSCGLHPFHHEGGYKFQQVVQEGEGDILGDFKNSTRKTMSNLI